MSGEKAVIVDNGTYKLKCGFAGDQMPVSYRSTVIYRAEKIETSAVGTQSMFGREGLRKATRPMKCGYVTDYDKMTELWQTAFDDQLQIDCMDRDLIMTEMSLTNKLNRQRITEIMFETFGFGRFFLGNQSVFALMGTGRMTGIVINSGFETTHIVPIIDGMSVTNSIQREMLGGNHVTEYMMQLLRENGIYPRNYAEFRLYNMAKDEQVFFKEYAMQNSLRPSKQREEMNSSFNRGFYAQKQLGDTMIRCPEILFNPNLNFLDVKPIHQMFVDSYNSLSEDLKETCKSHIVLAGANTMIGGFTKKMEIEVNKLMNCHFHFQAPKNRDLLAFKGASVFGTTDIENQWVTADEFEEYGSAIITRKCLM